MRHLSNLLVMVPIVVQKCHDPIEDNRQQESHLDNGNRAVWSTQRFLKILGHNSSSHNSLPSGLKLTCPQIDQLKLWISNVKIKTKMWLQAIQLINILLSAQNHRGDLLIQDQQRQVQQYQDHTQIVAQTVIIHELMTHFLKIASWSYKTRKYEAILGTLIKHANTRFLDL